MFGGGYYVPHPSDDEILDLLESRPTLELKQIIKEL